MGIPTPDKVLEKLPKSTPAWAVGWVSIVVAVALSIGTFYLLAKSEIEKVLEGRTKVADQKNEIESTALRSVLSLIGDNSAQITMLSGALVKMQDQNIKLNDRVALIEKDLAVKQASLTVCEKALIKCGVK